MAAGRFDQDLILRRRAGAVSKDGRIGALWFETREDALPGSSPGQALTMRIIN
jgi:hypothetical protein